MPRLFQPVPRFLPDLREKASEGLTCFWVRRGAGGKRILARDEAEAIEFYGTMHDLSAHERGQVSATPCD